MGARLGRVGALTPARLSNVGCRALGNIPGIPKVHYKGRQGDYYIMVCCAACMLWLAGVANWPCPGPEQPQLLLIHPAGCRCPAILTTARLLLARRSWTCWAPACGTCGTRRVRS